ncbi:hypothetical protein DFH09DRAFT_1344808 [Mycena vulgaris]|nr:hypothetical protein DFH09DRAFT_1344808 [Mycena vulgaris]
MPSPPHCPDPKKPRHLLRGPCCPPPLATQLSASIRLWLSSKSALDTAHPPLASAQPDSDVRARRRSTFTTASVGLISSSAPKTPAREITTLTLLPEAGIVRAADHSPARTPNYWRVDEESLLHHRHP